MKKLITIAVIVLTIFSCQKENIHREDVSKPKINLGLLPVKPSIYNSFPQAILPATGNLPAEFYLDMPPAGNQGEQGSCVAWAVAYGLKSYQRKNSDPSLNWNKSLCSPSYVYNQIKVGDCNSGSYVHDALNLIVEQGVCSLESMAYDQNDCQILPNDNQRQLAVKNKFTKWERVGLDKISIKNAISLGFPVVIAVKLDCGLYNAQKDNEGRFIWDHVEENCGNGYHAMVVSGYNDEIKAFKVLNSWGSDWFNNGSIWITYDVFFKTVDQAFIAYNSTTTMQIEKIIVKSGSGIIQTVGANTIEISQTCPIQITVNIKSLTEGDRTITLKASLIKSNSKTTIEEKNVLIKGNGTTEVSFSKSAILSSIGTYQILIERLVGNTAYTITSLIQNPFDVAVKVGECGKIEKPNVYSLEPYNITQTSVTIGGNVTKDGGASVTSRGICWSTSTNPSITNSHTNEGSGLGSFVSSISGLNPNTTYYLRAYASNSAGTSYGNEVSFSTTQNLTLPIVFTKTVTNITQTAALSGGEVTSDGGTSVTSRGICWSTSINPIISNSHTNDGSGMGKYSSNLFDLTSNTIYYVRSYAINSLGISYGEQISFTTSKDAENTLTDIDGNTYRTVQIGNQVWMAENLKVSRTKNGNSINSYYYNNDINYLNIYGRLYPYTVINDVCPTGWHIPTPYDWIDLSEYYSSNPSLVGGKLKEVGYTHWNYPNADATNSSDFTALPGGYLHEDGTYKGMGNGTHFWSYLYPNDYLIESLFYDDGTFYINNSARLERSYSIRCIKN